jgi:hypothetical protein
MKLLTTLEQQKTNKKPNLQVCGQKLTFCPSLSYFLSFHCNFFPTQFFSMLQKGKRKKKETEERK